MLKPYYTCGHVMCFNTIIQINWCIQCGCNDKNNESFCHVFNQLFTDDEDKTLEEQ